MNPFSIFTLFDWVTPTFNLARSIKRTAQGKPDYYLFVKDGFLSHNVGRGKNALKQARVPYRLCTYDAFRDCWTIEIDYNDYVTATSALRRAGVKYNE